MKIDGYGIGGVVEWLVFWNEAAVFAACGSGWFGWRFWSFWRFFITTPNSILYFLKKRA
jgi:hypothetical protein